MKDWKTTLSGLGVGIPLIIKGLTIDPIDWVSVTSGIMSIVAFFFAKDKLIDEERGFSNRPFKN